jgi:8-oxo-dGTP pyrophosphatase MutT (NUDIX family)
MSESRTSHPKANEPFDPATVPVRPAATVLLVRDDDEQQSGIDVFMLQRTLNAAFASGMYVFPGGRVDDVDGHDELCDLCDGLTDEEASGLLQIPSGGLAYWVAAIRECFEEAGVLLARHAPTGELIKFDDPYTAKFFSEARHRIHDGEMSLIELCHRENLHLITDSIHYVSHWVTPIGERRRFDTRFFVARAPVGQDPLHDDSETIDSLWVKPHEAIERHQRGELAMLPPTVSNLEFLLPHSRADEILAAARTVGVPPRIQPQLKIDDEGRVVAILMPGDPGFVEE